MFNGILYAMISLGDTRLYLLPMIIFLFMLWLMHRVEKRTAEEAIYRNLPFFKEAVNNFQQKLDYLHARMDTIEDKVRKLEASKPGIVPPEENQTRTPYKQA